MTIRNLMLLVLLATLSMWGAREIAISRARAESPRIAREITKLKNAIGRGFLIVGWRTCTRNEKPIIKPLNPSEILKLRGEISRLERRKRALDDWLSRQNQPSR